MLLLHHTSSDREKSRGSNALPNDVDGRLLLNIVGNVNPQASRVPLVLESKKARDGQAVPSVRLVKQEFDLFENDAERAAALEEENELRKKAGKLPLAKMDDRKSCVILIDDDEVAAPRRASSPASVSLPNYEKVVDGLRKLGGNAATNAQLSAASGIPKGSIDKAKKDALDRGLIVVDGKSIRLAEPKPIAA